jgi:hypothetical protein
MVKATMLPVAYEVQDDRGCAYVLDEPGHSLTCGAALRPGSSYCPRHHALCYILSGSRAEVKRLREVEALASAVGGRRARQGIGPSRQFLDRLEQALRELS